MKKRNVLLKSLVALTLLSAMIVSALLGTSNAEYFKTLKKKLDLEMTPDLNLSYYLYDAVDRESSTYSAETGVYKNSESFDQWIVTGAGTADTNNNNIKTSEKVVYKVKIPVDETGYYTLDFLTYMTPGSPIEIAQYNKNAIYTINPVYCVGCEVLTASDGVAFESNAKFSMLGRTFKDDAWRYTSQELLLYSDSSILGEEKDTIKDSVYQWKTLCPYRAENVKLTFKVEVADVENGYVIWAWDLTGLEPTWNYTLHVQDLSVNKTMNLDGTSDSRTSNDPYFMFPQTAYVNNMRDESAPTAGRGKYSSGRGTYVYEATENSLGMRAEMLFSDGSNSVKDNPLSLYIPLKNVKRGSTYKVTFDFSVARQGKNLLSSTVVNGFTETPVNDYHSYDVALDTIFENSDYADMCQSYLVSGVTTADNISEVVKTTQRGHTDAMDTVQYSDKTYTTYQLPDESTVRGYPLTKYDEFVKIDDGPQNAYVDSVNDTYAVNPVTQNDAASRDQSTSRNWFNGVYHTEYNGQYKINWVTFYNTTFSFNINNDVDLNDLYWVWAIDFLRYTAYYNIRIDNVRIQEVVEYSSSLDKNGVEIGGTPFSYDTHVTNKDATDDDGNVFISFRGRNGTGQNYQAKGYVLDKYTSTNNTQVFTNEGNIYAPIIDASKFVLTGDNAYKIRLDGSAVCQGGIEKYVFSIDGGKTWEDMTFEGTNASSDQLTLAEKGVNQYVSGQTRYDEAKFQEYGYDISDYTHVKFTEADALNGNFGDRDLIADLSEYKHQANLDVIIAAVPAVNTNFRCEILRIINFNQIRNYRTYTNEFVSDVSVTIDGKTATPLNANYNLLNGAENKVYSTYTDSKTKATSNVCFNYLRGWEFYYAAGPNLAGSGYARHVSYSHDYEDVRTLFSDFYVKTKLSITGWAIVEGGVDKYVWSADLGKTWYDCTGVPTTAGINTEQRACWYDGKMEADSTLNKNAWFEGSGGEALTGNNMLTADLSKYVGQAVDVIFCAKPVDSDVYVPVGRIDNVGVYGDPDLAIGTPGRGMGIFYSKPESLYLDDSATEVVAYSQTPEVYKGDTTSLYLSKRNKWTISIAEHSINSFEPNNVNPLNPRFYNNSINDMQSGGKVRLHGFINCPGGVKRYKYSLDGGETWTIIQEAEAILKDLSVDPALTNALVRLDASLGNGDIKNSSFRYGDGAKLEFNLPALPDGAMRNLLIVAESNIDDGTGRNEGFIYPVLHIKLRFNYNNDVSQYGYYRSADRTATGDTDTVSGWIGNVNNNEVWGFTPVPPKVANASNTAFNRITIPVTEAGKQQITFTHYLDNGPSVDSGTQRQIYTAKQVAQSKWIDYSLSVDKTHFVEGEDIGLDFSVSFNNKTSGTSANNQRKDFGTVTIAIVGDDLMGTKQYTLYSQKFAPNPQGLTQKNIRIDDITDKANGAYSDFGTDGVYSNPTMPQWALDLKPGTYTIVVIHRVPEYSDGTEYSLADTLYHEGIRSKHVLAQTTIYIHDKDEKVDFSVIHDEGEYTYFSDVDRQFTAADSVTNENIDHIYTLTDPFANTDARGITAEINVTEADVKRGYVILETDYTGLMSQSNHTKAECSTGQNSDDHTDDTCVGSKGALFPKKYYGDKLYNFSTLADIMHPGVKYNVRIVMGEHPLTKIPETSTALSIPFTSATSGYGTTAIKVPVTEAGTYDLSFGGYLNSSVKHTGYNNGTTNWDAPNNSGTKTLTINYSGAYMSLPKNVYVKGEDIPISYCTNGSVIDSTKAYYPEGMPYNSPWIGIFDYNITSTDESNKTDEEIEAERYYVQPDAKGLEYISTADLDPGTYKIYLRDNSAKLFHGEGGQMVYWWQYDMADPITVYIIDPEEQKITPEVKYAFFNVPHTTLQSANGFSSGTVKLDKTVFYQGEDISVTLSGMDPSAIYLRLHLYPENSTTYKKEILMSSDTVIMPTSDIDPGRYTLYLLNAGGTVSAHTTGRFYAVVDITILPESMRDNVTGNTDMHTVNTSQKRETPITLSDPFIYFTDSMTNINVTDADVERGYVFFEYDFTGLAPSTSFTFTVDRLTMTKRL